MDCRWRTVDCCWRTVDCWGRNSGLLLANSRPLSQHQHGASVPLFTPSVPMVVSAPAHPRIQPIASELDPHLAAQLPAFRVYHDAFLLEQAGDAGALTARETCDVPSMNCYNSCFKREASVQCTDCCWEQRRFCDMGRPYAFESCESIEPNTRAPDH